MPSTKVDTRPLHAILKHKEIEHWDIAIVGDGSAQRWEDAAGYCCVLIDRILNERKMFYSGLSGLTTNLAEMFPYVHALTWHASKKLTQAMRQAQRPLDVVIVTDSQHVAAIGPKVCSGRDIPKYLPAIYHTLFAFNRRGYNFKFLKIARDEIALNVLCDSMAYRARNAIQKLKLTSDDSSEPLTPDDFN